MNYASHLLLLLALLALVVDPGPRLRIPTRIRSWLRSRSRSQGAGASAAARARQLRTPAVRVADRLGIPTQRGREAERWEAGAEGERRTAALLATLERSGWTVLHDRALPHSRANIDHLVISRAGHVYLVDAKRWSARWPLTLRGGHLFHGDLDVTDRLTGMRYETDAVARLLDVPVTPIAVMHGPAVPDAGLALDDLLIVRADRLCHELARMDQALDAPRKQPVPLAARAERLLPPYWRGQA